MQIRYITDRRAIFIPYVLVFVLLISIFSMPQVVFAERTSRNGMIVDSSTISETLKEDGNILASSDQTKTTSDSDSALESRAGGNIVDIPRDASDGVTLASVNRTGSVVDIALPNAENAQIANKVAPGTVAYPTTNGSANAVQATEDGNVRMLTIINSYSAPTKYGYKISAPNDSRIKINQAGAAAVIDSKGNIVIGIQTPWAKDANGNVVQTYFTTNGSTLTQHVKHRSSGVAYPVTADPYVFRWYGADIYLNRGQTNNVMYGMAWAAAGSLGIPDPTISKIAAGALGVSSGYANWVYNRGGCLKLTVAWNGWWWIGSYYGGSCR